MTTRGSTLVELVVVLAVMGVIAIVASLAMRVRTPESTETRMSLARREALRTRRPVSLQVEGAGITASVTFMPDGSAIADSALNIDRLTGVERARQ